jgi:hypothetical protein
MIDRSPDRSPRRRREGWARDLAVRVALIVAVLGLSLVTVLRYTVDYLQADGVQQSVMSVQDVDLFFWGQNRFAAFVSALASPVAHPEANLFICLMINAIAFHVLLLIVAFMGTWLVSGTRSVAATAVTFLALALTCHVVITPAALHVIALESQPYAMSWSLTLGAFLLWKTGRMWWWVLAALAVGAAVGLNQSTILGAAFLAVIEMARRRQWWRWPAFGVVWLAWLGVWAVLASRYGGNAGPIPDATQDYFRFSMGTFLAEAPRSLTSVVGSFRTARLGVVAIISAVALLVLTAERRTAFLSRAAAAFVFAACYWVVLTGNPWVFQNGYALRYFFPTIMLVAVAVAAPLASFLCALVVPSTVVGRVQVPPGLRPAAAAVAVVLPVVGLAAALRGPLSSPADATVLVQTRATADYARANGVTFLSGYYWDMWPTLHRAIDDGRRAAFVTGFKSGGDPAAYLAAFDDQLKAGRTPMALCINESDAFCQRYLDYWTRPGWVDTGRFCPVPGDVPQLGSPIRSSCVVLAYAGSQETG